MHAMPSPSIRRMVQDDVEAVSAAILADDWGDRRAWFTFAVDHPQCRVLCAEIDGVVVATGVATISGSVGWIGTIWVASAWRGQGLGRTLTEAPIAAAHDAGCRTLVLVATDAGRPLYERLGFEVQTWYRTMEAPGLAADAPGADLVADSITGQRRIRPWQPDDLEAMTQLDAAATGEDRGHLLEAFATVEGTRVVTGPDDRLRAFLLRPSWGGGATIAPDPDDALALLDARRRAAGPGRRIRAGVVTENGAGLERLLAAGWTEAWSAPRLVRGHPMTWQPTSIWGQFNHALG
jgi:GNAT superfamily N-acetyltransferase